MTTTVDIDSRPVPRDDVLAQRAADTVLLLDVVSGDYYALDEVGARVWELADGSRSVGDIVTALCGEYDVPRATVETDALELLQDLADDGLVVDGDRPA